jgi:outer membrane protein assembly factor BamE (lipoprotein component of BamABCDE complex)
MTTKKIRKAIGGRFRAAALPALPVLAASAMLLTACAPGRAIDPQAQARAMAAKPPAPGASEFPAIETAQWKEGSFPNPENLRLMNAGSGMGKDQVRELLGWPHFREGLWGEQEWNYIFHLRTGKGSDFITCQYMVRFDDAMLSTGGFWKTPECAELLRAAAKPAAQAEPAPKPAPAG